MRRLLLWCVVFFGFAGFAFSVSVLLGEAWPRLWSLWVVVGIVVGLLSLLPKLREQGGPMGWALAYLSAFFMLWMATERLPSTRDEPRIIQAATSAILPVLAGFGIITGLLWLREVSPKARSAAYAVMPALLCGLIIAYFSGGAGDAGRMVDWAMKLLNLNEETAQQLVFWARKSVHFGFYAAFAACAWRASRVGGLAVAASWASTLLWAGTHAGFDELRQASVANRTGRATDLVIDVAGMLTALLFLNWRSASSKPTAASSDL